MMKILILVRGLPGAGKTSLAKAISPCDVAADDFFDRNTNGIFDSSLIKQAHQWCANETEFWMTQNQPKIAVHNTFTQEWEMQKYFDLADQYGYLVHSIIVENRHESKSIHSVPDNKVAQMKDRFEVNL